MTALLLSGRYPMVRVSMFNLNTPINPIRITNRQTNCGHLFRWIIADEIISKHLLINFD